VRLAGFTQIYFQRTKIMPNQEHTPLGTQFAENLEAERDKLSHEILALADELVARDEAEDHIAAELAALKEAQEAFQTLASHPDTLNDPALRAELAAFGNAIESQTEKLPPKIMALAAQEEEIQIRAHQARERAITATLSAEHQESITTQAEQFSQQRQLLADFTAMTIKAAGTVQPSQGIDSPSQTSNEPLSTVIEDFCINQIGEGNWTPKTDAENRAIYALWLRIVGDQPISGYGYEHHRAYKAKLQRLPPNINKSPRYRDKDIQAILALGDKPAAPNTINKNLIRIAALFKWAVEYGYTTLNPASGMTIKNPKRRV
jgi:hypothetical protein